MEQLPEIIVIDKVLYTLYTTPLLPWLHAQQPPPAFDTRAPNCERGYVGRWAIRDEVLRLTGLYAWRDGESLGVAELFDGHAEVEADWFTGPLVMEPANSEVGDGVALGVRTMMVEHGRVVRGADN